MEGKRPETTRYESIAPLFEIDRNLLPINDGMDDERERRDSSRLCDHWANKNVIESEEDSKTSIYVRKTSS